LATWTMSHKQSLLVASVLLLGMAVAGLSFLLVANHRAKQGRIVVSDAHRNAVVTVTSYSASLLREKPIPLGRAPVSAYLAPGLYRVTIDDGEFPVSTSSFLEPGMTDTITINKPTTQVVASLVRFESDNYRVGSPDEKYLFSKLRQVQLPSFLISRTEVSNREYRQYVLATNQRSPTIWSVPYDTAVDDLPVTDISWDEANNYCRWLGVRLPTPDEWEVAAQGPGGSSFPWGSAPNPNVQRVEVNRLTTEDYRRLARPVDSDAELATPRSIKHMLSNVQEFTEGYDIDQNRGYIVKGRSWIDSPFRDSSFMLNLPGRSFRAPNRGFRIALNPIEVRKKQ
jgi:formylglycine-generating enzyme required for sulfatase activity